MNSKKHILFFFNTLARTGSEVILVDFINELNFDDFKVTILVAGNAGELKNDLNKQINLIEDFTNFSFLEKVKNFITKNVLEIKLKTLLRDLRIDICYFNSLQNISLIKFIDPNLYSIYVHLHELSSNYVNISSSDFENIFKCNKIIVCSALVYSELKFLSNNISVVNSCPKLKNIDKYNLAIRDNNSLTIVTSGSISFRKGTDIWLKIVELFKNDSVNFIWLGKESNDGYCKWIQMQANKLQKICTNFSFITPSDQNEYYSIINSASYFLSSSREESMGMAMMEAQYLGLPVISLKSGGSTLVLRENDLEIDSFDPEIIYNQMKNFILNNTKKSNHKPLFNFHSEYKKWLTIISE